MNGTTDVKPFASLPFSAEYAFVQDNGDYGTEPVDLSKGELRDYSPFVLSVNAPNLAFGRRGTAIRPFTNPLPPISMSVNRQVNSVVGGIASNATRTVGGVTDESPAFTDREQVIDIVMQMKNMADLPPIVFLINPTNMGVAFADIQAFSEMSRKGFIFQRWGEDLPKLSFNFKLGAFVSTKRGLHNASRLDSASWRHLLSIFSVYRNSGAIVDRLGGTRANYAVGTQSIHYDGQEWVGRMSSFSYGLDENTQLGGIEVSFDFTVYKHFYKDTGQRGEVKPLQAPSANMTNRRRTTGRV